MSKEFSSFFVYVEGVIKQFVTLSGYKYTKVFQLLTNLALCF